MRVFALLACLLLAGCSGGSPGKDPGPDMDGATGGASSSTTDPPAKPLDPVEVYNDTIEFAAPGGQATGGVAQADVPKGYANVTVHFRILNDCPAGYAAESPRLVATDAAGGETELWAYPMLASNEPYSCPVAGNLADRVREDMSTDLAASTGTFTVKALGQYSADVELSITAKP